MKPKKVAWLSLAGMMASSLTVYAVTDPSQGPAAIQKRLAPTWATAAAVADAPSWTASQFEANGTLRLDARLGHRSLREGQSATTFVALDVTAAAGAPSARPPVHVAMVIDRSGSMKGERIVRAVEAAQGMCQRLQDGDRVTVISFDTQAATVVPTTTLSSATRSSVRDAIADIRLGGDTCVSCGIDAAMQAFDATSRRQDAMQRIVLLSDGQTNNGVRDVSGFRDIAKSARERGVAVSTIGVGLDYNEQLLTTLALGSNGMHHFVENAASLPQVFRDETESALSAVASATEVVITPAPGVHIEQVFERSFRREGGDIVVPLGALAAGDERSVLVSLGVSPQQAGHRDVVNVRLRYRDLVADAEGHLDGKLGTEAGPVTSSLDPLVAERLQRSFTTAALNQANQLVNGGNVLDARRLLEERLGALQGETASSSGAARGRFERQLKTTQRAFDAVKEASKPRPKPAARARAPRLLANDAFESSL